MAAYSTLPVRDLDQAAQLLQQLTAEEDEASRELEGLLEQQTQLDMRMAVFQRMLPALKGLEEEASTLRGVIDRASELADSVSCKVRTLDQAKSRVYACMKRVDDVIDLKSCVDGVQYAMTSGNYEKAAAHIHRYLSLDESILLETTADTSRGASNTVSSSFSLLRDAETQLKKVVRKSMADAIAASDHTQVERFFKIFPLLNLHKEGLQLFSSHLRTLIRVSAQASLDKASQPSEERAGVVYADTLTLLYESLARCLETNQPLVESYYGPHWMPLLVKELQAECDLQCSLILEQLQAERLLDHKVQTVSVALKSRSTTGAIRPDVLELDTLLSELSLCSSRTQLYFRFLLRKASTAGDSWSEGSEAGQSVEELIQTCQTSQLEQELVNKYIMIEDYFTRESLCKAVAMDTCNPDGCTSSMADDIFFVLQKCTRRAFSTGNADGACAVLNNASSLLLTEYKSQLQIRLQSPSSFSTSLDLTGMLQGKSRAPERRESEVGGASYMVALNDVEVSIDNINKLSSELQAEATKLGATAIDRAKRKMDSCLADFSAVTASFKELRQAGVECVVRELLVPTLQPAVSVFVSFSHVLSEEDFSHYEVNDPFVQQLLLAIENAVSDIKAKLIPTLFGHVFSEMTAEIAMLLEQQVLTCQFNQLGGVQLDKDLRALASYLSSITSWPVRDKFARLVQIAMLLTLETVDELFDYWGGSMLWRLTPSEIRRVLHLRTEFRHEDVEKIKLQ